MYVWPISLLFQCLCVLDRSSLVAKPPTVEHTISPVLPHSATTLPPPVRRDGSGSYHSSSPNPASPAVAEDGPGLSNGSNGQAQALYDYTGKVSRFIVVGSIKSANRKITTFGNAG